MINLGTNVNIVDSIYNIKLDTSIKKTNVDIQQIFIEYFWYSYSKLLDSKQVGKDENVFSYPQQCRPTICRGRIYLKNLYCCRNYINLFLLLGPKCFIN